MEVLDMYLSCGYNFRHLIMCLIEFSDLRHFAVRGIFHSRNVHVTLFYKANKHIEMVRSKQHPDHIEI